MIARSHRACATAALAAAALAAVALAAACAVDDSGANASDMLPDATPPARDAAEESPPEEDAPSARPEPSIRVHAGFETTCTIQASGVVQCWGANNYGQLGRGESGVPTPVAAVVPGVTARALASGFRVHCALGANDGVACWGLHNQSQIGTSANDPSLCVGSLPCVRSPAPIDGVRGAVAVSAGNGFGCAQTASGVVCWGTGARGEIGVVSGGGTVSATPNPIALDDVDTLVSGFSFSCARKKDGTVWCWGGRRFGEIGRSPDADTTSVWDDLPHATPHALPGLTSVRAVSAGLNHACVIHDDRTVHCWGMNSRAATGGGTANPGGQLGHDPTLDPMCFDNAGTCSDQPSKVTGVANARELALGSYHSCALLEDDTVVCWGQNDLGRLGHDPALDGADSSGVVAVPTPRPVAGLSDVAHISARHNHTCAVTWSSKVYCWGANGAGELGTFDGASSFTPVEVQGL